MTDGTFQLEPGTFLNSTEDSGNEIAVFRFRDDKIAQVWFYVDGYEPDAFSKVFAFD